MSPFKRLGPQSEPCPACGLAPKRLGPRSGHLPSQPVLWPSGKLLLRAKAPEAKCLWHVPSFFCVVQQNQPPPHLMESAETKFHVKTELDNSENSVRESNGLLCREPHQDSIQVDSRSGGG